MLSGAADIVPGLHDKVPVIQAGAIGLAGYTQAQTDTETPQLDFPHFGFGGSADCPEDVLSCNELEGLVDR
jgi:hypothetical protein